MSNQTTPLSSLIGGSVNNLSQSRNKLIDTIKSHIHANISPDISIENNLFDHLSTETLSRITETVHNRLNRPSSNNNSTR